jgi:hypothetical protein
VEDLVPASEVDEVHELMRLVIHVSCQRAARGTFATCVAGQWIRIRPAGDLGGEAGIDRAVQVKRFHTENPS